MSKRDEEEERRRDEAMKKETRTSNTKIKLLAVDRDTCPHQDNIIIKQQCSGCQYYKGFQMYKGELPYIECSYK